jgi:hypothetical protein
LTHTFDGNFHLPSLLPKGYECHGSGIALASAILALIFLPRRPDGLTGAPRAGAASPAAGENGVERAQLGV